MLEVKDVHVYYDESHIVHGVSMAVPENACVALVGRNGAGKTTLARSIMGLTPARSGRIVYRGTDLVPLDPEEIVKAGVAIVPQGRRVFRSLTVEEHLAVSRKARGSWTIAKVYEVFPRLAERRHNRGGQLSGGEQQMLAIARALVTNANLLVMDEPSEGLSPLLVREVREVVRELKKSGLSILLVEQNISMAMAVADEMYVMSTGGLVWSGTPEALNADDEVKGRHLGIHSAS